MSHAMLTMIAPLDPDRLADAHAEIDMLGNPAIDTVRNELQPDPSTGEGIHFASMHAFRSRHSDQAWILLEISSDGSEQWAIAHLVAAIGPRLRAIFLMASDWRDGADLARYLRAHLVRPGGGWFDSPGLCFAGTPGFSVGRIITEGQLSERVADLLAEQRGGLRSIDRLNQVRKAIERDPVLSPMLEPASGLPPYSPSTTLGLVPALFGSFIGTYLWPLLAIAVVVAIALGVYHWSFAAFLCALLRGLGIALALTAVLLVFAYGSLRSAEAHDAVDPRAPDDAINREMFARENRCRQNHMISITERKPGIVRSFTQRLVFWGIGSVAGKLFPPGRLGTIGSIHFARWVTVPRSRNLIFLSNYGGSWESYLEDFITRAHAGLTAVWSNTVGFPRSANLFQEGATDSEHFKRYARRSMQPTLFWYSAYPELTTAAIRINALIRRGLSGAMTEDEASVWLSLFGSAVRPPSKLVSNEIQSLLFGGLKFMPFGCCLIVEELPPDEPSARAWLDEIRPQIAYGDGRRLSRDAVVTLGLGPRGLSRLGLPDSAIATFPYAFTGGMTGGGRDQILGEDPATFEWGDRPMDAALLVYGETKKAVDRLCKAITQLCSRTGTVILRQIELKQVTDDKTEPFGFVDGISQPLIRGTYKALRYGDPIHIVEPGEFILGYPDNRGYMPPCPTLPAIEDPTNLLPLVTSRTDFDENVVESDRNIGFNGSFIVIRQLEQDVKAFRAYCRDEAERLSSASRLPPPYVLDEEFVAAKLVGRWRDGSSLTRFPFEPKSADRMTHETTRIESRPDVAQAVPVEKAPSARPSAGGDNDFLFGAEDPEALRCPFGAHIRRANPRDSLTPGSADEIDISNRHRIIRVGRLYAAERGRNPGLLFMCLNGDLERQFEFVQQTWLRNPAFHGLTCEMDPLLGTGSGPNCSYTIPSRDGPVRLSAMSRFVTTRGGGYFFLPGKRLVDYLAARP